MTRLASWNVIEDELCMTLVLVADFCRHMIGMGNRGDAAASAILGIEQMPRQHLNELFEDDDFAQSVSVSETQFAASARRCYKLITTPPPLDEVDVEEEKAHGIDWLRFFFLFMPREAIGDSDLTETIHDTDAPLVVLLGVAEARIALAEYVQNLVRFSIGGVGFTPKEIAFLGDVEVHTVYDAMAPEGGMPVSSKANPRQEGERLDFVLGNPLDAIEWLAGQRGFRSGGLSPRWVNGYLSKIHTLEAAAGLPGLVTWLNRRTSEQLAQTLGWTADQIRDWTRARIVSAENAEEIGMAAGLDGIGYRELITRLTA